MYHNVERLVGIRMRMATVQNQLDACYRSLVKRIMDRQLEPEDVEYIRNTLYLDVHNRELCHLLSKLDRCLSEQHGEIYEEEAEAKYE